LAIVTQSAISPHLRVGAKFGGSIIKRPDVRAWAKANLAAPDESKLEPATDPVLIPLFWGGIIERTSQS
jgi:hypothetical protein